MSMTPSVIYNYCMDLWSLEMLSVRHWIHNKCNGMKSTMCPCPDFNRASCLGLASPMDGADKMEVEFGDEKKQRENTHQEASIEVMTTWLVSRTNMSNKVEHVT